MWLLFFMMRLLITRHGKTKHNEEGIIQGKEHGSVNEDGFKQIKTLIQRLKKENINRIISSDIPRCRITAEEILKEIHVPIEYTQLLREKDNGDFVGKKGSEIYWDSLSDDFDNRRPPNGESLVMVRERGRIFIKGIIERYKDSGETILIISHGAFLKVLIGDLLGMNLYNSIFKLFVEHCSLTEIEIDDKYKEKYQLKFLNEKKHLESPV
jgi:broad specificity phosphatase PhoE